MTKDKIFHEFFKLFLIVSRETIYMSLVYSQFILTMDVLYCMKTLMNKLINKNTPYQQQKNLFKIILMDRIHLNAKAYNVRVVK